MTHNAHIVWKCLFPLNEKSLHKKQFPCCRKSAVFMRMQRMENRIDRNCLVLRHSNWFTAFSSHQWRCKMGKKNVFTPNDMYSRQKILSSAKAIFPRSQTLVLVCTRPPKFSHRKNRRLKFSRGIFFWYFFGWKLNKIKKGTKSMCECI